MQKLTGKVVTFKYSGGSIPGSERLVLVSNQDDEHLEGTDLHRHEFRRFFKNKCKELEVYETTIQSLTNLPDSIINSVIDHYADEDYSVTRYNHDGTDYVVAFKDPQSMTGVIKVDAGNREIVFRNGFRQVRLSYESGHYVSNWEGFHPKKDIRKLGELLMTLSGD